MLKASARRGFTLIELLVVIAIIGILAALVGTVYSKARKTAKIAEAATGIDNLKTALGTYHTAAGQYPGAGGEPRDDPAEVFRALYLGRKRHLEDWPREKIGLWPGQYKNNPSDIYDTPNWDQIDVNAPNPPPMVFLDPWGRPYHYVEWSSKPTAKNSLPGGQFRRKGGQPMAIWSDGPDKKNDWGADESDDITSWGSH